MSDGTMSNAVAAELREALEVPPGLQAQLAEGEHVIEIVPVGRYMPYATSARITADGGLTFRCFAFSNAPGSYWYEIGREEGGPLELSPEGATRLRALLNGDRR
jgi:hypothetical protein